MPDYHSIRLRGPWELRPLWRDAVVDGVMRRTTDELPPGGRVAAPGDWSEALGADFCGAAEYRRRFGRPSGLSAAEQVWIVCDGVVSLATLSLNGDPLGSIRGAETTAEFNVTGQLAERNELVVLVEHPAATGADPSTRAIGLAGDRVGGLVGEVRLEIRPTEFTA